MTRSQIDNNQTTCPFCGLGNNCEQAKNNIDESAKSNCWCMDIKLTEKTANILKQKTNSETCLCKTCLTKLASIEAQ